MKRILLSWSSGKDSAWALHVLRRSTAYDVVGLLTTFNHAADRVAMHAVRRSLVEQQAAAVGIPLWTVQLPWPCSNSEYDTIMAQECEKAVSKGIAAIAFGDLFLEDVRSYREKQLEGSGLQPLFPIWGSPTRALAQEMIFSGMRAKLTCIDTRKLDSSFAGRDFDQQLLSELPEGIDPCGENGEFHSFVFAAPIFCSPLSISSGEIVLRDGFAFSDVIPLTQCAA
jgi:uncharacterized protein (TIGR00290 family)